MKNAKWENVYVFISSTFNDMHAERDYLVKRVFPELRLWCAKRRLKLIDIDLRWGVSEKDASENRRVIDVCMKNINKCRPFFLGFLGQRRGWVPNEQDINKDTLTLYPQLKNYLGNYSITELEIIHALIHPFDDVSLKVSHAFFYFRNADYMKSILHPSIRKIYMPIKNDVPFETFKKEIRKNYPVFDYTCKWNTHLKSNELVNVNGKNLSKGRLEQFKVGNDTLKDSILFNLKQAIMEEFPNRENIEEMKDTLNAELFHQDTFLFQACDSYIPRILEEKKILDYVNSDEKRPFVLKANAGSGKTSMLAHLIAEKQIHGKVFYRFCGTSIDSSNTEKTLLLLAKQMLVEKVIDKETYEKAKDNIILFFPTLLNTLKEDITIILDALDQWDKALEDLYWMPSILPENVKLIVSIRSDSEAQLLDYFVRHEMKIVELESMHSREEKSAFIKQYMGQYLKDISDQQMEMIFDLEGANNPLYLKIVLNELRIHGSFDTLVQQLKTQYGKTPMHAFAKVIERLEKEEYSTNISNSLLVRVFLGTLAYSLDGMNLSEYVDVFKGMEESNDAQDIMDGVYELARHLSPYLTIDGDHVDFLYDSFRKAVQYRYGKMEDKFHMIIMQTYLEKDLDDGDVYRKDAKRRSTMIKLFHHSLHYSEEMYTEMVSDVACFYSAILNMKTNLVVENLLLAVEKGYSTVFSDIAFVLQSASVRIDINPDSVFYELKQRLDNTIVRGWIEQAKEGLDLTYFAPLLKKDKTILPVREMAFIPFLKDNKKVIIHKYAIYITNDIIWKKDNCENSMIYVQNIENEKIECTLQLSYPVRRFNADDKYLYIVSAPSMENDDVYMEIYEVPTLRKIMSKKINLEVEKGMFFLTFAHGYNGVMYDVARSKELPLRIKVYRINDETVMFENVYENEKTTFLKDGQINTTAMDLHFYGPFFSEENSDQDIENLWHVPSRTCIEKNECRTFSYEGFLDQNIFYFYKKKNDYILCDKYIFDKDEIISKNTYTLQSVDSIFIPNIASIFHHFLIEEGMETLRVYDEHMELKGYVDRSFTISQNLSKFPMYAYKDYLLVTKGHAICFYKFSDILESIVKERPQASDQKESVSHDGFVYEDDLYLIGNTSMRLETEYFIPMAEEKTGSYIANKVAHGKGYTPSNIYNINGKNYQLSYSLFSYNRNKYEIRLHRLNDLKIAVRFYKEFGDNHIYCAYCDDFNIGIVVDKDYDENTFTFTPDIHVYSSYDFSEVKHWEIDVRCKEIKIVTLHNKISYIACLRCQVDDKYNELRIYHAKTCELIYCYRYEKDILLYDRNMYVREERIIFYGYDTRTFEFFFVTFDFSTKDLKMIPMYKANNEYGHISIRNVNNNEIFVHIWDTDKIYVYSIHTLAKTLEIDLIKDLDSTYVLHKYGAYINVQKDGRMDLYDEKGNYIMSHLLPEGNVDMMDIEHTKYFYVGYGFNKYTFYTLCNAYDL